MELIRTGKEIHDFLVEGLNRYNHKVLGLTENRSKSICFEVVNDGKRVAGIESYFYLEQILYVALLFVDEDCRQTGIGSRLLSAVEEEGKKLGATIAHVDTFDFQAKDFYPRHGYTLYGVMEDCPPGHARYYFRKAL